MVAAYVLIQTEVGKAAQVATEVADIPGVTSSEAVTSNSGVCRQTRSSEAVTGPYDCIVHAEAEDMDALGKLVVARVQAIEGITRTLTCPVVKL